ncbi:serine/threonine-protein kinase [Mariniblastus fucicola]|uniref:non-specific serine/threonine protein kinase n=1 Tax=Mariniblastus fucicola TaxID=980251 RepID=A0A5B9PHG3_9BACT|nr:serine/threonine-protein kinase [Mariniblastus fucicola]QEG22311.1 Serine/threonine-protein kinase PrkC [Mariniblastus fucicola]
MSEQNHISDLDLQLIVSEQPTKVPQDKIETHVANCSHCQDRLLSFAANESWRDDFCSSIIALEEQLAFEETDTRDFEFDRQSPCNQFDLRSVDQLLDDVLNPPTHPETLGRLGRYEIEKVIGYGGMGIVLRGFDHELHRPVAIKMIAPRLVNNGTAKERFLREAKAAGALLHPNVIAIHDISESNGVPWFVMPLVVGPTLQEVVDKHGPLPAKEVVRIGKQIASGLAAAHQQGLVHRDIKPANILVDNQINRIVITDFGLARREAEESMTQTGMVAGTLNYMSPEQSRGEDVDARSDLFSLGSLLFFLSTGVTPFRSAAPMGVIHKVGNENHANAQSLNPDVPTQLARMIDRLLEKLPEDRFQSSSDVEAWLEQFLAHLNQPVGSTIPALPKNPSRSNMRASVLKWIGLAVPLAGLGGLIFYAGTWFVTAPEPEPVLTWGSIQRRHQIETVDTFEADLMSLTEKIDQFSGDSWRPETQLISNPDEVFNSKLGQLDQSVTELSELLDDQ